MLLRPQVQQAVAGAAVEAGHRAARRQASDIGDTADVEHGAVLRTVAEDRGVERRRKRRALAAGGDVAAAKVRHHGDGGELREQRGIADLQRIAPLGAVAQRLPVAARGAYLGGCLSGLAQELGDRGGVAARELVAQQRGALELVVAGEVERKQARAQRGVERLVRLGQDARHGRGEVGEHRVDPVEAGA